MKTSRYRDYNSYLRGLFGCRVQKITVDAGFTCPNRDGIRATGGCIYCNARGSGTGAAERELTITAQLETGKAFLQKRYKAQKFLAYFQAFSNTYAPLSRLQRLYQEALAVPDMVGLTIGTRPDCVADEALDYLAELARTHLIWLEYGLQSAHDATLALINRGHDVASFKDAAERTRKRGLPVCVHVILGLPGESRNDMLATARFLASQDIQAVKIHLLYVIRGTVLEQWYRQDRYRCLTRDQYVSLVADFLSLLPESVIIQRLTGDPHPEELVAPSGHWQSNRFWRPSMRFWRNTSCVRVKAGPHMSVAGVDKPRRYDQPIARVEGAGPKLANSWAQIETFVDGRPLSSGGRSRKRNRSWPRLMMENSMSTPVLAPMVGRIIRVTRCVGDTVKQGDDLMVMASMKLESPITAPCGGVIETLHVTDGSRIREGRTSCCCSMKPKRQTATDRQHPDRFHRGVGGGAGWLEL